MKKIFCIILALLTVTLVSCDKGEERIEHTAEMNAEFISEKKDAFDTLEILDATVVYQNGGENTLDADYFEYYFGDATLFDEVTEYLYYTSAEVSVCEVGLFRVNADAKEKMYQGAEHRRDTLSLTFEPYSKTDAEIADGMEIGIVDDVVWFVATSDNTPVVNVIIPE
jgi:hypothetical protein